MKVLIDNAILPSTEDKKPQSKTKPQGKPKPQDKQKPQGKSNTQDKQKPQGKSKQQGKSKPQGKSKTQRKEKSQDTQEIFEDTYSENLPATVQQGDFGLKTLQENVSIPSETPKETTQEDSSFVKSPEKGKTQDTYSETLPKTEQQDFGLKTLQENAIILPSSNQKATEQPPSPPSTPELQQDSLERQVIVEHALKEADTSVLSFADAVKKGNTDQHNMESKTSSNIVE